MKISSFLDRISPIPRQYWGASAVLLAIIMSVMDVNIVNIALPTLTKEFSTSASSAIWVVNAYQLVITMFLLSFASLGDLYGYKRIFLIGMALFVIASALCALSQSLWQLVASRILQGLGAAGIMSVNTALLRLIYPPKFLGRGMGVNAVVVAVSAASGPSVAGALLSTLSWHWLFLINLPIGCAAFFIGRKLLPQNLQQEKKGSFDKVSCISNALTFGLLIYSLEGFAHNENSILLAIQLIALVVIGAYFIFRQTHVKKPIFPVDLLRIPIFSLSMGCSVSSFTAQMLAMVSLPFFLQNVLAFNAAEIGLLLTPWPLGIILTAPIAGRLIEKIHPGLLGVMGMSLFACGLLSLYFLPPQPEITNIIWRMFLCGMGFGLFQTPNNFTIVSSAPNNRSGAASGMLGTARLLGQTLGTTLVALLFRLLPTHQSGAQSCLLLASIIAIVAAVISSLRVSKPIEAKRKNHS